MRGDVYLLINLNIPENLSSGEREHRLVFAVATGFVTLALLLLRFNEYFVAAIGIISLTFFLNYFTNFCVVKRMFGRMKKANDME